MNRLGILIGIAVIGVLAQAPGATHSQAGRLSQQEQRGEEIYFGIEARSDRRITAVVGNPPTELTGSLTACVGCHGKDGKGNPEAAIVPSSITWADLMKPRDFHLSGDRTRPSYTERMLVRAVCMGIDPAGNHLHIAMPRFQMSREDIHALISYLKLLVGDTKPGPSDSGMRVGRPLPITPARRP